MAIIYTYPTVTPSLTDKVLISGEDNKTQNATLTSIKDVLDVVDTFSSSFGTFISGTNNASATGNVSIGTIDLSATGTPSINNFLRGDNTWNSISLTTDVTGILPIANGGTNASTANAAINNLLPDQTGQDGYFLQTDGTTTSWVQAQGSGTITGSGTANQVAYFSGNSAIAGQDNLTLTNSGILKSGSFSDDIAGSIYIENETGNVGGTLRLYGKENDTGASKYIVLNASQSASATAYNLYFPPTVASAAGKVLKSAGANGELEWGDDNSGTIGGTVSASDIPVGTAANTLGNSIMSQHVATSSPTHNRIRIESPVVNPNLGQFPSLQLYNGSNGSWSTGAILSEIQTYSADGSTPSNPHVCSFINTVRGEPLSGAAVDGELVFGTAPYNEPVGAQESMRIDRDGSILVKQVGISTDDNYRTGNVSVQNTGEFRLYGSSAFTTTSYHSIRNNNGALEIGDQAGISGTINFFVDQASALEINDSAESTFKGPVTIPLGAVATPSLRFPSAGSTTGIYSSGVDSVDVTGSGTAIASFASTAITLKQDLTIQEETTIQKDLTVDEHITGNGHFTLTQNSITQSGNTATCDLTGGNQFYISAMNSAITVTFTNAEAGDEFTLSVTRTANGAQSNITWGNAYWPGGVDPGQTNAANKVDIYKFTKVGSDIFGRVVGLNYTLQS